jgi:hypothetical protein
MASVNYHKKTTHSTARPYECRKILFKVLERCGKTYKRKNTLNQHLKRHQFADMTFITYIPKEPLKEPTVEEPLEKINI